MSTAAPERPDHPALHGSVPAGTAKRILRGVLGVVLALTLAGALGAAVQWLWPDASRVTAELTVPASVASLAVVLAAAVWSGLAGGWLPDLFVGTRVLRVQDGRRPGLAGLARTALSGAAGLASAGVAPILVTALTGDRNGRTWLDRLTGTAVVDVRRGRNLLARPVTSAERELLLRPPPVSRPAIITVRTEPGSTPARRLPAVGTSTVPIATTPDGATTRVAATATATTAAARGADEGTRAWVLAFDTGERHILRGQALVGRQPRAQADARGVQLISVSDPSRTVSATHLAVTGNDLGVWVEDLGSTNGSEVQTPNGRASALPVRVRTAVPGGSRVRIGDRWMTIERARA